MRDVDGFDVKELAIGVDRDQAVGLGQRDDVAEEGALDEKGAIGLDSP